MKVYQRDLCKECLECGHTMSGIHSYQVREVCYECGGTSKVVDVVEPVKRDAA